MRLNERLRKVDQPPKSQKLDVRKEATEMVRRHERQLKELRESTPDREVFRQVAMKQTEEFTAGLKDFLHEHQADELYEELVGFVSGKVQEIVQSKRESSS